MELTINIGFEQVLQMIKQLPASQIEKLKFELTDDYIKDKAEEEISEFQKLLLQGPVMTNVQYKAFIENRKSFDSWRIK